MRIAPRAVSKIAQRFDVGGSGIGIGIAELVPAALFKQFSQGDPFVKPRYGAPVPISARGAHGCHDRRCQRGRAGQPILVHCAARSRAPGSAMPPRAADLKGARVLTANAFARSTARVPPSGDERLPRHAVSAGQADSPSARRVGRADGRSE